MPESVKNSLKFTDFEGGPPNFKRNMTCFAIIITVKVFYTIIQGYPKLLLKL